MSTNHGRFCWYDLLTPEPEAAVGFYTRVVGWKTEQFREAPYTMWATARGPIGGVGELPQAAKAMGAPPHWRAYIEVGDMTATVEKAKALGATVLVPPTDIPNTGDFAVLADPQGAVLALYHSYSGSSEAERPPQTGDVSWHELLTTDHVAAWSFYSTLFGWEKTEAMDMGPMGVYQMFGRNGISWGGMFDKPPAVEAPPFWLYYIKVDNIDDTVQKIKVNGGRVLNGPMEVPGGDQVAQCMDPQGAAFAIHGPGRK
jgi:predicted enzyme related to lactoylglutathione lyase